MTDEEWQVCGVCARVLERVSDRHTGEVTWLHPTDVRKEGEDHPAVPVPQSQVQVAAKCDFCFADGPTWMLPVDHFPIPGVAASGPEVISHSNWSTCDDCGSLIRRGYWERLADRAARSFRRRHGAVDIESVRALYREVQAHTSGPLHPIE